MLWGNRAHLHIFWGAEVTCALHHEKYKGVPNRSKVHAKCVIYFGQSNECIFGFVKNRLVVCIVRNKNVKIKRSSKNRNHASLECYGCERSNETIFIFVGQV